MKRLAIAFVAITALAACENEELLEAQSQLADARQEISDQEDTIALCEETAQKQKAELCEKLETVVETYHVQYFEVGDEDVDVPCNPAGGSFSVRVHKDDTQRGWAYLRYDINGNTRFSDRLVYAVNGGTANYDGKADRNSLRVIDPTFSDSILLSVETCDADTNTCSLSCRVLANHHETTCTQ